MINGPEYNQQGKALAKKVPRTIYVGTMRVPLAPVFRVCLITLGIRYGGGQSQLFSPDQSQVKASIASEPRCELNLGSWVLM